MDVDHGTLWTPRAASFCPSATRSSEDRPDCGSIPATRGTGHAFQLVGIRARSYIQSVVETIRPLMFIGSSSEGLPVARALQEELEHDVDAKVWDQGVFGLSDSSLEPLERHAGEVDFAVFVLTADDLLTKRGDSGEVPRDNVLFEAGLFIGRIGRHRAFLVSCRDDRLELPSDLRDVTRAEFNRRADIRATIGPAAERIRRGMKDAPPRPGEIANPAHIEAPVRVRSLAHEVITELETNRYQLSEAKARAYGWSTDDLLAAAKFDKWQKDPDASADSDVMDALRATYVWMHRKNIEMQEREHAAWNAVGRQVDEPVPGLALDANDLAELDEGMSRIMNAQDRLRALIEQLACGPSSDPSLNTSPAEGVAAAVGSGVHTDEDPDGRQAFAIVIRPQLAVRTIFDVDERQPTGDMFLEVHNASQFTAADVEAEVRYRDGRVKTDTVERMNPDHVGEPRWKVRLVGVSPAPGDIFADVRQQIETVTLSYGDVRRLARYRVEIPTNSGVGEPFELALANEQRTLT
jgi:Predicted nucleotide-binding protein containing TIR-like domain